MLKKQQDLDKKVKSLWDTISNTLDFMNEAEPLTKIKGMENTVRAILDQIYKCANFLREYREEPFIGKVPCICLTKDPLTPQSQARTVQYALTVKTDADIQDFIDTFIGLKTRFQEGVNIESWKVANETKNGVLQLVDSSQHQDSHGKHRCRYC